MSRRKGPARSDLLHRPETIDEREFEVHRETLEPPSSRVWWFDCPFCLSEVKAYVWSLSGGGKRCVCGAKFSRRGDAIHWRTP